MAHAVSPCFSLALCLNKMEVERNMGFKAYIGGVLAVWKRNPWMKIDSSLAKKDYLWSHVPSWTGNKALRPAGVVAINDIFKYVAKKVAALGWTVADNVRMIGAVMDEVDTYKSKAAVDEAISAAERTYGRTRVKVPATKRLEIIKARHERVPAYERLAAALTA